MLRILLIFLILATKLRAGTSDSLLNLIKPGLADSTQYLIYYRLADFFEEWKIDSSLYFIEKALQIAHKNEQWLAEAAALNTKGYQLSSKGDYDQSLTCLHRASLLLEDPSIEEISWHLPVLRKRQTELSYNHYMFGILMDRTQNLSQEHDHFLESLRLSRAMNDSFRTGVTLQNLVYTYIEMGKPDSALICARLAQQINANPQPKMKGWQLHCLGWAYLKTGRLEESKKVFYEGIHFSKEGQNQECLLYSYADMARVYLIVKNKDSSLLYSNLAISSFNYFGQLAVPGYNLGDVYELKYLSERLNGNNDSANRYLHLTMITRDSLYQARIKNIAKFQSLSFDEQLRLQELEKEKIQSAGRMRTIGFLTGVLALLIIALILYRKNKQVRLANNNLSKTLADLKSAQARLIQSEKMASLGELTTGIAHEIQNPLNFVNNFSEINKELVQELQEQATIGNLDQVKTIAEDIKDNEEKIIHHGKRADSIVKSMLEHSRSHNGQKEQTDINALAEKWLRLAAHGIRSKDSSFDLNLKTDFDGSIGLIKTTPQEIGRVLLNLYNNAFYSVREKKRNNPGFDPEVIVKTQQKGNHVLITVSDNGIGIPEIIIDKIFQPFFTTKPTGQGTGLGLSLSYDIIKAHGGEIRVNSRVEGGAEFIVDLPEA